MLENHAVIAEQASIVSNATDLVDSVDQILPLDADKLDSYKKPRSVYYDKIRLMDEVALLKAVHNTFVQCHLGGDADARWKVDALEWECNRRSRNDLYDQGYDTASKVDLTKMV